MPGNGIFHRLHREPRETRSFDITRHDAGWRRAVCISGLEKSNLKVVTEKPNSSKRAVYHHSSIWIVELSPIPSLENFDFESASLAFSCFGEAVRFVERFVVVTRFRSGVAKQF
ncbi:hypothetical protein TNCV_140281 [Trichonephila clavipes]|uniref:Uncharacterized protein n=1 Tax=Trichonephila clavipes TaxID=2585209 RepID=A0A8X6RIV6_TRICX|nr:hypothetical protein TNCV_140281 [Trichonephila clavipes]